MQETRLPGPDANVFPSLHRREGPPSQTSGRFAAAACAELRGPGGSQTLVTRVGRREPAEAQRAREIDRGRDREKEPETEPEIERQSQKETETERERERDREGETQR